MCASAPGGGGCAGQATVLVCVSPRGRGVDAPQPTAGLGDSKQLVTFDPGAITSHGGGLGKTLSA